MVENQNFRKLLKIFDVFFDEKRRKVKKENLKSFFHFFNDNLFHKNLLGR